MNTVTILWSAVSGACLMLGLIHLAVWIRNRKSWASFWFFIAVLGVIGTTTCELVTMNASRPEVYAAGVRSAHLVFILTVAGIVGFVHCHFGTGRIRLLWLAIGLRVLAIIANFTTGQSLHVAEVRGLERMTFLGETVTILGDWVPNRWVLLGQISSLLLMAYVADASCKLWRSGTAEDKRRAWSVGGSVFFFLLDSRAKCDKSLGRPPQSFFIHHKPQIIEP